MRTRAHGGKAHRAEAATRRMGDECPGFYKILCPQFFCEFLWVLRLCVLL